MAVCASWGGASGHSLSASLTQMVLMLAVQLRPLGYTRVLPGLPPPGGSRGEALSWSLQHLLVDTPALLGWRPPAPHPSLGPRFGSLSLCLGPKLPSPTLALPSGLLACVRTWTLMMALGTPA